MLEAAGFSKSQIDKLGDRLRQEALSDSDLRLLDEYRRSFASAYEIVVRELKSDVGLESTGRPAKSTPSIIAKLRRESVRLSQIQDIAGCRLTVRDVTDQDAVVGKIQGVFPRSELVDRRSRPSYGYRGVHIVVDCERKLVEVQVRTLLQHQWAELSEKISDLVGIDIKYGGGNREAGDFLLRTSALIARTEGLEVTLASVQARSKHIVGDSELLASIAELERDVGSHKNAIRDMLADMVSDIESVRDRN